MAVWITDQDDNFVRTITKMGVNEDYYLFKWKLSALANVADAITGATLTSHESHNYVWDCKNKEGVIVSDGAYSLNIEFADDDSQGPVTKINFTKGDTITILPTDETYFIDMRVKYISDISSVEELENNLEFIISPNPATNYIQVSIFNNRIDEIEIFDINGKNIIADYDIDNTNKIDISTMKTGVYFVFVKSGKKAGIQKLFIQ